MKRKQWKNKSNVNFLLVCSVNAVMSCKSLITNCYKFAALKKYNEYRSKINTSNMFFYCCNYSDVHIRSYRSYKYIKRNELLSKINTSNMFFNCRNYNDYYIRSCSVY